MTTSIYCLTVYYRPQRSWAKVIFLHLSVILLTGGGTWSGTGVGGVPGQVPGGVPGLVPGGCTWSGPRGVYLVWSWGGCTWSGPGGCTWQTPSPPGPGTPPGTRYPPGIRTTSGRYASYWNAFLFFNILKKNRAILVHDYLPCM